MTEELKQKAFNFLEKHTYYDECKGTHYRDLTEIELFVLFAEEAIYELDKKNAELEYKLKYRNCVDCSNHGSNIKLLKAKEIIKKFLLWENAWHNKTESKYELLKQAEQFLKEIKEK